MHNGWKFVSEPHIVYLEPEYEGGKSGKKSPVSQSSLRGRFSSKQLCRKIIQNTPKPVCRQEIFHSALCRDLVCHGLNLLLMPCSVPVEITFKGRVSMKNFEGSRAPNLLNGSRNQLSQLFALRRLSYLECCLVFDIVLKDGRLRGYCLPNAILFSLFFVR